jgi:hypothetical protein
MTFTAADCTPAMASTQHISMVISSEENQCTSKNKEK